MDVNYFKDIKDSIKDVSFLIYPIIPERCITTLASQGGVGKSGLALQLSERLLQEGKSVLYLDAERGGSHIKQRIKDWHLDNCLNSLQLTNIKNPDGSTYTAAPISEDDLKRTLDTHRVDLIIIDSLTISTKGLDTGKRSIMAVYMENLSNLAFQFNTTFLILAHINKKQDLTKKTSVHDISGSAAIVDLSRSVLLLDYLKEENDPERTLTQVKQNLTAKADPILLSVTPTGIVFKESKNKVRTVRSIGKISDAERFRQRALKELENPTTTKQDAIDALKELGADPAEYARAIDWASKQLNITWEN